MKNRDFKKLDIIVISVIVVLLVIVLVIKSCEGAESNKKSKSILPNHLWGAYSERTPNEEVELHDYEYSLGIGSKRYEVSCLFERENANYFKEGRALIIPTMWSEIEWFLKEAQNVDSLSFRAFMRPFEELWLIKFFKVGLSYNTQHLKDGKCLFALAYHLETKNNLLFTFSYENNFLDRTILFFKTGIKIPKGNLYILPFFERREATGTRYYRQTKYKVGWQKE